MAAPNRFRTPVGTNDHGKLYEGRVAKKIGARLTPNSGAMVGAKGDMSKGNWLIESKTTKDASLSIQLAWLVKITEEAQAKAKAPALLFSFVLPDGRPKPNAETEWVAVPLQVWKELTGGH